METITIMGNKLTFVNEEFAKDFLNQYLNTDIEFYRHVCNYENCEELQPTGLDFPECEVIDMNFMALRPELEKMVEALAS